MSPEITPCEVHRASATALETALRAGELSAVGLAERLLERAEQFEPRLHVWTALDAEQVIAAARMADGWQASAGASGGPLGALHGLPVGVKDIIETAMLPTGMGSPLFAGHHSGRDAALVQRLLAAGAVVMGKTVTTEFAFTRPSATRNPWNTSRTPGGSSSGSAAGVAAGIMPLAIGTQTNGSIIRPASFCGVVGFKPTVDLLPMGGVLPFSPTLDTAGVFARSVGDAALLAAALAEGESIMARVESRSAPPRIGVIERFPWAAPETGAAVLLRLALEKLADAGAMTTTCVPGPDFDDTRLSHRIIMLHEAAREHAARQRRERSDMSAELNAGLDEGRSIAVADYRSALARRGALIERSLDLFEGVDVIACLAAPGAAPPLELGTTGDPGFCTLWSLLGFAAISLPMGLDAEGMPVGLQLAAPAGQDDALLAAARWCESVLGFDRRPPLFH